MNPHLSPLYDIIQEVEDHHHAVGAFLKYVEAAITDQRFTTYLNDPEVDKVLNGIVKAIQKARPVLDRRRSRGAAISTGCRPGGDTYFGNELDVLHKLVYAIETKRQIFQDELQARRKLDRMVPLEDPDERRWRRRELALARFQLPNEIQQELADAIGNAMSTARGNPQVLPEHQPAALDALTEPPMPDRHTDLRTALLENPDQPQAAFVKLCHVHPNTVRRCRRKLEEAGAIPYLAHRHAT